jgi:hypothetical protein
MLAVAGLLACKKAKNTIIFAFTADEESDGEGAKALLSLDCVRRSGLVLIPEPTSNQIGVLKKGPSGRKSQQKENQRMAPCRIWVSMPFPIWSGCSMSWISQVL